MAKQKKGEIYITPDCDTHLWAIPISITWDTSIREVEIRVLCFGVIIDYHYLNLGRR